MFNEFMINDLNTILKDFFIIAKVNFPLCDLGVSLCDLGVKKTYNFHKKSPKKHLQSQI